MGWKMGLMDYAGGAYPAVQAYLAAKNNKQKQQESAARMALEQRRMALEEQRLQALMNAQKEEQMLKAGMRNAILGAVEPSRDYASGLMALEQQNPAMVETRQEEVRGMEEPYSYRAATEAGTPALRGLMQGGLNPQKALSAAMPYMEPAQMMTAIQNMQNMPLELQNKILNMDVMRSTIKKNESQADKNRRPEEPKKTAPNMSYKTEEKYDDKTGVTFERSFNYNPQTGEKTGYSEWTVKKKDRPPAQVNVTNRIGSSSMEKLGEEMSKELVAQMKEAQKEAINIGHLDEAERLLDAGMITGTGAEFLTNVGNFLSSRLGINLAKKPVDNTLAYAATMGRQVGQIIKQFGSGTGLSDADREYAEKIAGGKVSLTKDSIKKLLDINRRISIFHVTDYNRRAEQAMKKEGGDQLPYDLRVNMPQRKKRIVERRVSQTGKTLVKYDDGTIGEE